MNDVTSVDKHYFLPDNFSSGHNLCFVIHDILAQLLVSGERAGVFVTELNLDDEQIEALNESSDVIEWLEHEGRFEDKIKVLKTTILPAILSDSLHCIYEALKSSVKAKLNITYMLIRKPIQESLYLLESIVLDEQEFSNTLSSDPMKLRPKNAGGVEGHQRRIERVLEKIGKDKLFDSQYIAQLRYDKNQDDNFDGICNHAMHLFTEHKAIKTDKLNINFIFSDWDCKLTQWGYFYGRFPYLLMYLHEVVMYICSEICPSPQEFNDDMNRRLSALIMLWWYDIDPLYQSAPLQNFVSETEKWLDHHCISQGYVSPSKDDYKSMSEDGGFPGESAENIEKRKYLFEKQVEHNRVLVGN